MKRSSLALLVFLPLTLVAGEIKPGDRVEAVLSTMGAPRGRLQIGERERLCFDRGDVEVRAGVVTRVALRSAEAQAAFEARSAADAERVRSERSRSTGAGEALMARKLADSFFRAAPLGYQIAFWENFARQYPTVSCQDELDLVRARLAEQEEAARLAETRRIAELEAQATENARAVQEPFYYYPIDYSRGYYVSDLRLQRLDRQYDRRVHGANGGRSAVFCPEENDWREHGRHHDAGTTNNHPTVAPSRIAPTVFAAPSPASSHTAEAFAGKNWMGWPTTGQTF